MSDREEFWTRSGVRLRRTFARTGSHNWLFVPGGPGVGSESLQSLADTIDVPGAGWLVDLPGDGSNRSAGGANPFTHWPHALVEAAQAFEDVVMVGHSTGGMLILAVPELRESLTGLVLADTAPHAGWSVLFDEYVRTHPIPAVGAAAQRYDRQPDDETLRALTLVAAPWNFTPDGLSAGLELFDGLAYNHGAVQWAAENFDKSYRFRWAPDHIPTLIVAGACDNIVDQSLWTDIPEFHGPNIMRRTIPAAGHFPWIENPRDVATAFAEFADLLKSAK